MTLEVCADRTSQPATAVPRVRTFTTPLPVDLLRSLRPLVASANDPTIRVRPGRLLRASVTPERVPSVARAWGHARMQELVAPFAPHRGRVVRLLLAASPRAPTFGARQRIVPIGSL